MSFCCAGVWAAPPRALSAPYTTVFSAGTADDAAPGAVTAWTEGGDAQKTVRVQKVNGAGDPLWGPGGTVVASGQVYLTSQTPSGDGGAFIVYSDPDGTRIQRISAAGAPVWPSGGPIILLNEDRYGYMEHTELRGFVADGQGGVYYSQYEFDSNSESNYFYVKRLDASGNAAGSLFMPAQFAMTGDSSGGFVAVYRNPNVNGNVLVAQRYNSSWTPLWGGGVVVCDAPGDRVEMSVSASGSGSLYHIAWWDDRAAVTNDNPNDVRIFVQLLNDAGQAQWADDGVATTSAPDGAPLDTRHPYLMNLLPHGQELFVMWGHSVSPSPYWSYRVKMQRISSTGTRLWGGGEGVVLDVNYESHVGNSRLISDGADGVIAGWGRTSYSESDTDHETSIYLQRLNAVGQPLWGESPLAAASLSGQPEYLSGLINSGPGQALLVWQAEALWTRVYPDWTSSLRPAQRLRVNAGGTPWQVVVYDYSSLETAVLPLRTRSGAESYLPRSGPGIGLFLYDYGQARFTQAKYGSEQKLD